MTLSEYNVAIHNASKAAGIFCPKCTYCFNGVLDDSCGESDCTEDAFEKEFNKLIPKPDNQD